MAAGARAEETAEDFGVLGGGGDGGDGARRRWAAAISVAVRAGSIGAAHAGLRRRGRRRRQRWRACERRLDGGGDSLPPVLGVEKMAFDGEEAWRCAQFYCTDL